MIYLVTGVPGAGKTLNTIKWINEDSQFRGRDIYYHRVKELTLPWSELTEDQVKDWESLPDGSVIFVDEAQYSFPKSNSRGEAPEYIRNLTEHRHRGFDFILVTQHPSLINVDLRRLVQSHVHYHRSLGLSFTKKFSWERFVTDPTNKTDQAEASVTRVKFDKEYFGCYKSAEVHTAKPRIPFRVWSSLAIIFGVIILSIMFFFKKKADYLGPQEPVNQSASLESQPDQALSGSSFDSDSDEDYLTKEEWAEKYTPRFSDIPWSAPAYDEAIEVKSVPRPQCMMWESGPKIGECTCYTQQATKLNISYDACVNYVKYRYFDVMQEDFGYQTAESKKRTKRERFERYEQPTRRKKAILVTHKPRVRTPKPR